MEAPSTHQDTTIEIAPAPAPAVGKGKRKRVFSEDDLYLLLHRCSPTTILTALREVAQHAGRRNIDWRELVAKTATGITSAREYQMLWRHFAYRHDLADNVDVTAQPLGDESDLECEIESVPTPSNEALAEASDFAKVLLSGSSRKQASSHHVNSEPAAPRTTNKKIPRVQSSKHLARSHRLANGACPVSSSNQASHTGLSPDTFDGNGPHNKKKKPKPWIKEEDLTDGVYKCGEGNLHNRNAKTPLQLSQGRAMICKRQKTSKPANAKSANVNFDIKTTQKACSMAVDMPVKKPGLSTSRSGSSHSGTQHSSQLVFGATTPRAKSATASSSLPVPVPVLVQVQPPPAYVQQAPAQSAQLKASNTSNKPRKQAARPNPTNAPSSIQALATAAGGQIATPSVAASLIRAAQYTKALHVKPRGGAGSSETSTGSKTPAAIPAGQTGTAQLGSAQQHPAEEPSGAPAPSPHVVLTAHATSNKQARVAAQSAAGVNIPPEQSAFPEDAKLPETVVEPKDAHMLEFDRYVAKPCLKKGCLDESEAVKGAPGVEAIAPFAGKKTESTLGPPAGASSGLAGAGNSGVLSKAVWGKAR